MQISISHEQGNVAVIQVAGQLDGQSYQDLILKAQEIIGEGAKNILLDMSELTYISSAGLVALHTISMLLRGEKTPGTDEGWSAIKSMDRTRDGGVQKNLKFLNPPPQVVSVLDMVGFSEFFEVFTDKQKAIESF
jgi:anti-anti-sigma regulatory factor